METLKINLLTIFLILSLPLIILFSIAKFAWRCARAVVNWLTEDFKEEENEIE